MLTEIYNPGESFVHKAKPSLKLAVLFSVCTLLFVFDSWAMLISVSVTLAGLYFHARILVGNIIASIRPAFWILTLIFAVQFYLEGPELAAFVVIRFAVMILTASLLTLTTPTSELVSTIEHGVRSFASARTAEAVSLAFSLSFRFIPQVRNTFEEVKEAQRARGLHNSWRALVTPTIVRTLKSADEIAQAINARNIDTSHLSDEITEYDK